MKRSAKLWLATCCGNQMLFTMSPRNVFRTLLHGSVPSSKVSSGAPTSTNLQKMHRLGTHQMQTKNNVKLVPPRQPLLQHLVEFWQQWPTPSLLVSWSITQSAFAESQIRPRAMYWINRRLNMDVHGELRTIILLIIHDFESEFYIWIYITSGEPTNRVYWARYAYNEYFSTITFCRCSDLVVFGSSFQKPSFIFQNILCAMLQKYVVDT